MNKAFRNRRYGNVSRRQRTAAASVLVLLLALILCLMTMVIASSSSSSGRKVVQIASPLQSLTIWDDDVKEDKVTYRQLFLEKFRIGLQAEVTARDEIIRKQINKSESTTTTTLSQTVDPNNPLWAQQAAEYDRKQRLSNEKLIESAYDTAIEHHSTVVAQHRQQRRISRLQKRKSIPKNQQQKYQFVGVINPATTSTTTKTTKDPITWYAREKPIDSSWTVRLVHVNRGAIIKDLFDSGKVDIFASYKNLGRSLTTSESSSSSATATETPVPGSIQPKIVGEYTVRKKTWKNLWNFSPRNFITDSSGMYWRERRLPSGLYTDGTTVYESSYRYRDGRNGMHRISTLKQYLNSKAIDTGTKDKIVQRLQTDTPDIVLEE